MSCWRIAVVALIAGCADQAEPPKHERGAETVEAPEKIVTPRPAEPTVRREDGMPATRGALPRRRTSDEPGACTGDEPGRTYTSRSVDECARINFACVQGTTSFSDACGCGCESN